MKMIFTHKSLLKSPSIQRTQRERETHTHMEGQGERERELRGGGGELSDIVTYGFAP
jgi:hypothetical protein